MRPLHRARRALMTGYALLLSLTVLCIGSRALAHKASDSYLMLEQVDGYMLRARIDLSLRDVDDALGLDEDGDGRLTWHEALKNEARTRAWVAAHIHLTNDEGLCTLTWDGPLQTATHSDGRYLALLFALSCERPLGALELRYDLLFDVDAQHRGVTRYRALEGEEQTFLFSEAQRRWRPTGRAAQPWSHIVREGVVHIAGGRDHLAFLFALLLPAVYRRRREPVGSLREALLATLKVVSAFTVAHSVTLSLAALGWVSLPSRLVETCIALSVVVAAANNVGGWFREGRWGVAFALGLIHGFGFSSALADLGVQRATLLRTLVGFNLGVELGQLIGVALFLPLAFSLRRTRGYGAFVRYGSILIAVWAMVWVVERVADHPLLPPWLR